jgi:hypothetical protein
MSKAVYHGGGVGRKGFSGGGGSGPLPPHDHYRLVEQGSTAIALLCTTGIATFYENIDFDDALSNSHGNLTCFTNDFQLRAYTGNNFDLITDGGDFGITANLGDIDLKLDRSPAHIGIWAPTLPALQGAPYTEAVTINLGGSGNYSFQLQTVTDGDVTLIANGTGTIALDGSIAQMVAYDGTATVWAQVGSCQVGANTFIKLDSVQNTMQIHSQSNPNTDFYYDSISFSSVFLSVGVAVSSMSAQAYLQFADYLDGRLSTQDANLWIYAQTGNILMQGDDIDILAGTVGEIHMVNNGDIGIDAGNIAAPNPYITLLASVAHPYIHFHEGTGRYLFDSVPTYADNASALAAGYITGMIYRNGDALQIVH